MQKEEIFKIINELKTKISKDNLNRYLKNHHPDVYNEIQSRTINLNKFIVDGNKNKQISLFERLYCIEHDLSDRPKCNNCNTNYVCNFNRQTNEYSKWCSPKCQASDKECIKKSKQTKLSKYGNENFSNIEKSRETRKLKYGSYSPTDYSKKVKQSKLKHYGDENYNNKEKMKDTKLKRYGDENYNNKEKMKDTKLKRYGDENYNNREKFKNTITNFSLEKKKEIQEKRALSNINKYGVKVPTQNSSVIEKTKNTFLQKYGVDSIFKLNSIREMSKNNLREKAWKNIISNVDYTPLFSKEYFISNYSPHIKLKWKCNKCENEFNARYDNGCHLPCPKCFPRLTKGTSQMEHDLFDFIKSIYSGNVFWRDDENKKFINNREIDIIIPEKKIAIEFDGLYWHSDENKKIKKYHLLKTEECEKKDYQLIHIFENEWIYKQDIVKSRLKNLLGVYEKTIYARKCDIKNISMETSLNFQNTNHIQGAVYSPINLGLFFNDELIATMTFSKCRFDKKHEWELVRFCTKMGYHVIGGASKLLKYFENNYNPKSLVSYADRRWSRGNLYSALGFTFSHNSSPNYWYFKKSNQMLESRIKYQKHKLKNILEIFDNELTEYENMKNNGYNRIYDCGNMVFEKIY
jgi:hypothetical protein